MPADTSRLHELVYGISDGLFDPSRASILVRPVKGYVNAPVARDDVAQPKPGETSTVVDALANDTDIDSDPATLTHRRGARPHRDDRERPGAGRRSSTTRTPCRTSSRTRTAPGRWP